MESQGQALLQDLRRRTREGTFMAMRSVLAMDGRGPFCTQSNAEKGRAMVPTVRTGGIAKETVQCARRLLQIQDAVRFQVHRVGFDRRATVSSLFLRQEASKMGPLPLHRMWRSETQERIPKCLTSHSDNRPKTPALRRVRCQAPRERKSLGKTENDGDDHTETNDSP